IPGHLWTSTLAMFFLGERINTRDLFRLYLQTRLTERHTEQFKAFERVLTWIVENRNRTGYFNRFRQNALREILRDTSQGNRYSAASDAFRKLLEDKSIN